MIWTAEETEFLKNNYLFMTQATLADELGKTDKQVANKLKDLRERGLDLPTHRKRAVYAYYAKGKFVNSGTVEEISEATGIKEDNLRFYATPAYARRTSEKSRRLVRIEGEYDFVFSDEE